MLQNPKHIFQKSTSSKPQAQHATAKWTVLAQLRAPFHGWHLVLARLSVKFCSACRLFCERIRGGSRGVSPTAVFRGACGGMRNSVRPRSLEWEPCCLRRNVPFIT